MDPELSYEWIEGLAMRKARWAYHELKCFLRIIRHEEIDPLEVYGSYAGALGMAPIHPFELSRLCREQKKLRKVASQQGRGDLQYRKLPKISWMEKEPFDQEEETDSMAL